MAGRSWALRWTAAGLSAAALAGCSGGDDKGGADPDATHTDPTGTSSPWPDTCVSGGPDALVTPAGELHEEEFEGFTAYSMVPEGARALVVYFHGGDRGDELLQPEQSAMYLDLGVREGLGVVATRRTVDGANMNWDLGTDFATNLDAPRVDRLLRKVRADHGLPDDLPLVTSGFSDGAGFADSFATMGVAEGWPVVAAIIHNGAFGGDGPPVDTQYHVAENDHPQDAESMAESVRAAGFRAEAFEQPERVVAPEMFLRNGLWTEEQAQALFDSLVADRLVDADGTRLVEDAQMEPAIALWGRVEAENLPGMEAAESRLRVLWATHRFSAYDADAECRFILDAL